MTNLERARRAHEAASRGDLDGVLSHCDPDIEVTGREGGDPYRGHDGVRRWWRDAPEAEGLRGADIQGLQEHGDWVVARVHKAGARGDGDPEPDSVHATRWRDGRSVGWRVFRTLEEALEAVLL